jgi:hypothetical protein
VPTLWSVKQPEPLPMHVVFMYRAPLYQPLIQELLKFMVLKLYFTESLNGSDNETSTVKTTALP